jgi:hypothetical protein
MTQECTCQQPKPTDPDLIEARRQVCQGRSAILEIAIMDGAWDRGSLVQNALAKIKQGATDAV